MNGKVQIGFERESVSIAMSDILPVRKVSAAVKASRKYQQIAASIREAGIAQPPLVARHGTLKGKYLLVDGNLRIEVLKELGVTEVTCLVSIDDEAFTYNRHVNRLATIQEHRMILKLIERGVPEERTAETLHVNVESIRAKLNLLHGVCPEAAALLEDKQCSATSIQALKKMKPVRQIEAVELMIAMNNFTVPYANALVASTPPEQLVDADAPKAPKGVSREQIAKLEREMATLHNGIKRIEATFGSDHLHLVLAVGYVSTLLSNAAITRYLEKHHREISKEFARTCGATALGSEAAE